MKKVRAIFLMLFISLIGLLGGETTAMQGKGGLGKRSSEAGNAPDREKRSAIESLQDLSMVEKSAERGDLEAAVHVAEYYLFGPEESQDFSKALGFLEKASDHGNLEAIELLAGMYLNGKGVQQDTRIAAQLYERCAMAGHGPCQFNLGIIYKNGGDNLPPHPLLAYYWLYRATLNDGSLGEMIYDAAAFRNEVALQLSHFERMSIVEKIYYPLTDDTEVNEPDSQVETTTEK